MEPVDFYSSTSSDDQGSQGSVIHVEGSEAAVISRMVEPSPRTPPTPRCRPKSAATTAERDKLIGDVHLNGFNNGFHSPPSLSTSNHVIGGGAEFVNGGGHDGRQVGHRGDLLDDDSTDTSGDDLPDAILSRRVQEERAAREGADDSSSTSSEETQIWVSTATNGSLANKRMSSSSSSAPVHSAPTVSPKSPLYGGGGGFGGVGGSVIYATVGVKTAKRQSVVNHSVTTGQNETSLHSRHNDDIAMAVDSGFSNESPESCEANAAYRNGSPYPTAPTPPHFTSQLSCSSYQQRESQGGEDEAPRRRSVRTDSLAYVPVELLSRSSNGGSRQRVRTIGGSECIYATPTRSISDGGEEEGLRPAHSAETYEVEQDGEVDEAGEFICVEPGEEGGLEALEEQDDRRHSLSLTLSIVYCLFIVVLGALLPIANAFSTSVTSRSFEWFYVGLCVISLVLIVIVHLLVAPRTVGRSSHCVRYAREEDHPGTAVKLLARLDPRRRGRVKTISQSHSGGFYLRLGLVVFGVGAMIYDGLQFGKFIQARFIPECFDAMEAGRPLIQIVFIFVQMYFLFLNAKAYIQRCPAFVKFALMHLIATNLCIWIQVVATETYSELGDFVGNRGSAESSVLYNREFRTAVANTLDMDGTNLTSTAVVSNTSPGSYFNVESNEFAVSTKSWAVTESLIRVDDVAMLDSEGRDAIAGVVVSNIVDRRETFCEPDAVMLHVLRASGPYLYPCVIQYSILAVAFLLTMWCNIRRRSPSCSRLSCTDVDASRCNDVRIDCSGNNCGLFFGILTLVGTIGSLIFCHVNRILAGQWSSVRIVYLTESSIYCFGLAIMAVAALSFCRLRHSAVNAAGPDNRLNVGLLVASLAGVFVLGVLSSIAAYYLLVYTDVTYTDNIDAILYLLTSVLMIAHGVMQTMLILVMFDRRVKNRDQETKKPGRECITLLILHNIALWTTDMFKLLNPETTQSIYSFYSFAPWSVAMHLAAPLVPFLRFHSAICLSVIWKNAYQPEQDIL